MIMFFVFVPIMGALFNVAIMRALLFKMLQRLRKVILAIFNPVIIIESDEYCYLKKSAGILKLE